MNSKCWCIMEDFYEDSTDTTYSSIHEDKIYLNESDVENKLYNLKSNSGWWSNYKLRELDCFGDTEISILGDTEEAYKSINNVLKRFEAVIGSYKMSFDLENELANILIYMEEEVQEKIWKLIK